MFGHGVFGSPATGPRRTATQEPPDEGASSPCGARPPRAEKPVAAPTTAALASAAFGTAAASAVTRRVSNREVRTLTTVAAVGTARIQEFSNLTPVVSG
ncbi:hypothetical protein GCM10012285_26280 [Streptomyces kronopolitis]|uniref:Uncharacterized protein n=1 Tax=Streptomyces kronopolitis TaxID=1612435 RepID=A0ABQ2JB90_9ACTN|nr:hypothetical protein GCM10012285_26280 [Streptomyces kronopolitis]